MVTQFWITIVAKKTWHHAPFILLWIKFVFIIDLLLERIILLLTYLLWIFSAFPGHINILVGFGNLWNVTIIFHWRGDMSLNLNARSFILCKIYYLVLKLIFEPIYQLFCYFILTFLRFIRNLFHHIFCDLTFKLVVKSFAQWYLLFVLFSFHINWVWD